MTITPTTTRRDLFRDDTARRYPRNPPAPGFGNALRQYRVRAGLTMRQLSARMGRNEGTISYLESGARNPSPVLVLDIAAALGLSESDTARLQAEAGHWPANLAVDDVFGPLEGGAGSE